MRIGRIKTISLQDQRMWVRVYFPEFRCRLIKLKQRMTLVCRGTLQPTPINNSYQVRIEYSLPAKVRAWVEDPELQPREAGGKIPHTFKNKRPCLYWKDFRSDMQLATTVFPWLMCWLFFYESWFVTGDWQGGGVHPTPTTIEGEAA